MKNSISKKTETKTFKSTKEIVNEVASWVLTEHIKETPFQNYYNEEEITCIILKITKAIILTMLTMEYELKLRYRDKIFNYKSFSSIISSLFNQEKKKEALEIYEIIFLNLIFEDDTKMEDFNLNLYRIQ